MFSYLRAYVGVTVRRFCRDEKAASAIEYGLLAAGIAVVIIVAVFAIGGELNKAFLLVEKCLKDKTC